MQAYFDHGLRCKSHNSKPTVIEGIIWHLALRKEKTTVAVFVQEHTPMNNFSTLHQL
jgi:hypothetical protein